MIDISKLIIRQQEDDIGIYREIFQHNDYQNCLKFKTKENSTIVDLGAHVGYVAAWFHNNFPTHSIVSVEPNKDSLDVYRENCKPLLGEAKALPINAFVAAKDGMGSFYKPHQYPYGWVKMGGNEVPCYSVSTIMQLAKITEIDILKVDIEGTETELFEYCSPWIGSVNNIVVETHKEWMPQCIGLSDLYIMLDRNGAKFNVLAQLYNRIAFIELVK